MLESEPRRLLLVALIVASALAASPAAASVAGSDGGVGDAVDGTREGVAEGTPTTGTGADPLVADTVDPDDGLADVDDARGEAARHAPATGNEEVDGAVREGATTDTRPVVATAAGTARKAVDQATDALGLALTLLPDEDPVILVVDRVDPIYDAASGVLADSDAYEVEDPAPASGDASAVAPDLPPGLVMAGAGAAAAAAIVALWLAGSSGSLGAAGAGAGAGAGAAGSSELRRLMPFASPLFTRFERDTVLGHPKREALYALILQDPGVSLQALCDQTGLSRTAVTHHLRLLEMQHLIVSKRLGRSRHYYENGGRFGRDQKEAYAVLHNARSKEVARYVRDHPGAIQKAVCEALGIQPSIAHWHLRRLQEAQLVQAVRHGRTVSYLPGPGLATLDRPVVPPAVTSTPPAQPLPAMPALTLPRAAPM